MAYKIPTFKELVEQIELDFYSRFDNNSKVFLYSVIKVLARVIAGVAYPIYLFIQWIIQQIFPDKSEEKFFQRWANLYNVQRKNATYSQGKAVFKGLSGSKIPIYTKIQTENNLRFQTTDEGIIKDNGITDIPIYAMQSGNSGNLKPFTKLNLISPINNIDFEVRLTQSGTYGGSDLEDLENWRKRFLDRLRKPPCAGNKDDYVRWAKELPEVTRAWCTPCFPAEGFVGLTYVKDNNENIFPSTEEIEKNKNYILSKMGITAKLNLFILNSLAINFEIKLRNNNLDNQNKIKNILRNVIKSEGEPNKTISFYQFIVAIQQNYFSTSDFIIINPKEDIKTTNIQIHTLGNILFKNMD